MKTARLSKKDPILIPFHRAGKKSRRETEPLLTGAADSKL